MNSLPAATMDNEASPVSVWMTAQESPAIQRKNRYVPESTAHPAKMLPAIAQHAIEHYTNPGDLVLDPMCGIGTTLVEATYQQRRAVGVEYETHWVEVTQANLKLAHHAGLPVDARVFHGDARHLSTVLPDEYREQAALVITSPPYGSTVHGQVTVAPKEHGGIRKYHHRYGNPTDRGQLANVGQQRLLSGFTRILTETTHYLRPGGHVVITVRPWREHGELVNLPHHIVECGIHAGLMPTERCVALLGRITDTNNFVARGSFYQHKHLTTQRAAGIPQHLIAHEDVIILRKPTVSKTPRPMIARSVELEHYPPYERQGKQAA